MHDQREQDRLLLDAAMMLALQAAEQITQEEYTKWRDRWLKEYSLLQADQEQDQESAVVTLPTKQT